MSEFEKMDALGDSVKQYIQLQYEILKLEATKKASEIGSSFFSALLLGIVFLLFFFAVSMGVGFYLSSLLGDSYSGFLIIAGFYLLISIILLIGRHKLIEKPLRNKIIKTLFADKES